MADVEVRFEREGLSGIVAVGSRLSDVFKRFGLSSEDQCSEGSHHCEIMVTQGAELLSEVSDIEKEHFGGSGRSPNRRLACESKIIRSGEIVIMTEKKSETSNEAPNKDSFQKEFEALPLEQKITNLFKMEVVTLGETLSYVANSVAEFGSKIEKEVRKATSAPSAPCAPAPESKSDKNSSPKSSPKSAPPAEPHVG